MTSTAELITRYSQKFNRRFLTEHGVASPLGVWLLLALSAPSAQGAERAALEFELGTSASDAFERARQLLRSVHPAVGCAVAVWARERFLNDEWHRWSSGLPDSVESGPVPDQHGADEWARTHSRNLIDSFPVRLSDATALVLASALSTAVTWSYPFRAVPVDDLGGHFGQLITQALAAPSEHTCLLVDTDAAGLVGVHGVNTDDGLAVVSVIAARDISPGAVHDAAGQVSALMAGREANARRVSLFDLPLGEGVAWTVTERVQKVFGAASGRTEELSAVLAPWSAGGDHDLLDAPGVSAVLPGFEAMLRPQFLPAEFQAKQVATARYSRTGFAAAAVSALSMQVGSMPMSSTVVIRSATIRFNRPHAVVAIALNEAPDVERGWGDRDLGVPHWANIAVFNAWITTPSDQPE